MHSSVSASGFAALVALGVSACRGHFFDDKASASQAGVASVAGNTVPAGPVAPVSYADIVDRVSPAVVTIRSSRRARAPQQFPFLDDPFFRRFFGNGFRSDERSRPSEVQNALGSGVIVAADGHILTNHHVVDGAEEIKVDLKDRRTFAARLVGSDAPSDLAVLQVSARSLPALTLADSDRVRVGDICLALGNPLGLGQRSPPALSAREAGRRDLVTAASKIFCRQMLPSIRATRVARW
jgi:serine protease Do